MANRAGLKKVTKTVRGKKGAVKRTYWVRATDAVKGAGRFLNKHKGKIAAGLAVAGAAALAAKHRGAIGGAASGALKGIRTVHKLGQLTAKVGGPRANLRDYVASAKIGGILGGIRGHMKDADRRAASATASQQSKNRRDFVVSGLRDAAGAAVRQFGTDMKRRVRRHGPGAIEPGRKRG